MGAHNFPSIRFDSILRDGIAGDFIALGSSFFAAVADGPVGNSRSCQALPAAGDLMIGLNAPFELVELTSSLLPAVMPLRICDASFVSVEVLSSLPASRDSLRVLEALSAPFVACFTSRTRKSKVFAPKCPGRGRTVMIGCREYSDMFVMFSSQPDRKSVV